MLADLDGILAGPISKMTPAEVSLRRLVDDAKATRGTIARRARKSPNGEMGDVHVLLLTKVRFRLHEVIRLPMSNELRSRVLAVGDPFHALMNRYEVIEELREPPS